MTAETASSQVAFPFLDLPPEIRHQIYKLLMTSTEPLWLHESLYTLPKRPGPRLKCSPQVFHLRAQRYLQRAGLEHWNIGGITRSYVYDNGRAPRELSLYLPVVNHQIDLEVPSIFFGLTKLWIRFDSDFVAFLSREMFISQRQTRSQMAAQLPTHKPRTIGQKSPRRWITRFRHLTILMHEGCTEKLNGLKVLFETIGPGA